MRAQTRLIGRMVAIESEQMEGAEQNAAFVAATTYRRTSPFNEIDFADNGDQIP